MSLSFINLCKSACFRFSSGLQIEIPSLLLWSPPAPTATYPQGLSLETSWREGGAGSSPLPQPPSPVHPPHCSQSTSRSMQSSKCQPLSGIKFFHCRVPASFPALLPAPTRTVQTAGRTPPGTSCFAVAKAVLEKCCVNEESTQCCCVPLQGLLLTDAFSQLLSPQALENVTLAPTAPVNVVTLSTATVGICCLKGGRCLWSGMGALSIFENNKQKNKNRS